MEIRIFTFLELPDLAYTAGMVEAGEKGRDIFTVWDSISFLLLLSQITTNLMV